LNALNKELCCAFDCNADRATSGYYQCIYTFSTLCSKKYLTWVVDSTWTYKTALHFKISLPHPVQNWEIKIGNGAKPYKSYCIIFDTQNSKASKIINIIKTTETTYLPHAFHYLIDSL